MKDNMNKTKYNKTAILYQEEVKDGGLGYNWKEKAIFLTLPEAEKFGKDNIDNMPGQWRAFKVSVRGRLAKIINNHVSPKKDVTRAMFLLTWDEIKSEVEKKIESFTRNSPREEKDLYLDLYRVYGLQLAIDIFNEHIGKLLYKEEESLSQKPAAPIDDQIATSWGQAIFDAGMSGINDDSQTKSTLTPLEFAQFVDGVEIDNHYHPPDFIVERAIENNLVMAIGYSDNGVNIFGAVTRFIGAAYGGTEFYIDARGHTCVAPDNPPAARKIKAVCNDYSWPRWTFETSIPHARFNVAEACPKDGDTPFCEAIVFSLADCQAQIKEDNHGG
jgi:hypothetical protein